MPNSLCRGVYRRWALVVRRDQLTRKECTKVGPCQRSKPFLTWIPVYRIHELWALKGRARHSFPDSVFRHQSVRQPPADWKYFAGSGSKSSDMTVISQHLAYRASC